MNNNITVYIALCFTVLFWGLSFIGTKIALVSFSPFIVIFLRFALAAIVFIIILLYKGLPGLEVSLHKKLFLTALFEPGLYFAFETNGLIYTSASEAAVILALVPIAVMVLARIILGERITKKNIIGIVLSLVGIIILIVGKGDFSWSLSDSIIGDLLILGAVISAALYMIMARQLGQKLSALEITAFQFIYGTLMFLPFFLYYLPGVCWAGVSYQSGLAIVFLALFATITGFLLYNYALTKIQASRASVFINVIPVITAAAAWPILGEKLTGMQILGALIALIAVFITNIPDNLVNTKRKLRIVKTFNK